jgi:predicted nucleic acid-binding protein
MQLYVAEPPPGYGYGSLVIDASVLAACVFEEPQAEQARLLMFNRQLHAPDLLTYELANIATRKAKNHPEQASALSEMLLEGLELGIELMTAPAHSLYPLAHRYQLSAYDAAYLWVAEQLQAPLATFDAQLARAAREHLNSPQDPPLP